LLLRKKAAEELKKEQERKAAERRRIIEERCGKPKNIEDANEGRYVCSSFPLCLRPFSRLHSSFKACREIGDESKHFQTHHHSPSSLSFGR
jgi:hypothetical protein